MREWASTEFPAAQDDMGRLLDGFLDVPTGDLADWLAEPGDIHQELPAPGVQRALALWLEGVHGLRRRAAYATSSASSSEGGARRQRPAGARPERSRSPAGTRPERSRSPAGARPERGRSPIRAPEPRRSARANKGCPPGPDSLARGTPMPMDVASSDGGSADRPRQLPAEGGRGSKRGGR